MDNKKPQTKSPRLKTNQGYIALISVLIISALVLLIASSASLSSLSESDMGLGENQSWEAYYLANLCAEEALQQIRDSLPYEGSENISLNSGNCSYTVIREPGQNRTINATGTIGVIARKLRIKVDQINPQINVASWQEITEF